MAPITGVPTFGSAPINPNTATTASHASGTTPQTASSNPEARGDNEATVTAAEAATSTSRYPQAQPGAVPVPGPAPTGPVTASPYTPTPITTTSPPTTTTDQSAVSPPAPQPGSRPIPPPAASQSAGANDLPPPPKVGEVPKPASYYTRATPSTATAGTGTGFGYTTQATPAQGLNVPNSTSTPYNTMYQPPANNTQLPTYNYGAASRGPGGDVFQDEEEGVGQAIWKTAKSWVQTAGSKLAEVEAEVWKRVG
ncbi:hypothetical protein DTO217A2_580 [Paecilomyces variotii]|nr:hypothetical protein DTO217A2_580 [Paecilomyces variotii]